MEKLQNNVLRARLFYSFGADKHGESVKVPHKTTATQKHSAGPMKGDEASPVPSRR